MGNDLPDYSITMMVPLLNITVDHCPTEFCIGSSWIEGIPGVSDAGNATIESDERHGYGDNDDAGSEKYLLLLNNKGIYSEGLFLNFDWSRSGVPVAA